MQGRIGAERLWILIIGVGGAVAGAILGLAGEEASPPPAAEVDTAVASMLVAVHVSGWVAAPGVVWVDDGSLVAAAIDAAGGALAGAALDGLNLASKVHDGDQIVVPGPGWASGSNGSSSDGLIDINTADEVELQLLPGVGPVLAARIVAHRESIGGFESVEDLLDVPGIGETRLASIRDLIRAP